MINRDEIDKNILRTTATYVRQHMADDSTGHDWWHIKRVHDLALKINLSQHRDVFTIRMIALLHDLYDDKFSDLNIRDSLVKLMGELNIVDYIEPETIENIVHSIEHLGYKGGFNHIKISPEGQIVQDSDRLDSIGAIGIARVFAYGGKKGIPIYDPEMGIIDVNSEEDYRTGKRHSINHFYEKLLKIGETMNTDEGKRIAIKRTQVLKDFLDEFYSEWNLEDKHLESYNFESER